MRLGKASIAVAGYDEVRQDGISMVTSGIPCASAARSGSVTGIVEDGIFSSKIWKFEKAEVQGYRLPSLVGVADSAHALVVEGLLRAGAMPDSHRQYVLGEDVERRDEQRAILNEMERQNHVVEVFGQQIKSIEITIKPHVNITMSLRWLAMGGA